MNIKTKFEVKAPLEAVWRYMLDVQKVAPCVPGAQLTEVIDDRTFAGKIGVKLGPIDVGYRGKVHIDQIDEQTHRVRLKAEGSESRGRGGATATVTSVLSEQDGQTRVEMDSEVAVTGLVAQFGRSSIMQEVSQRMAERFARCLEQSITQAQPAAQSPGS
jgi:carbon monoxide dehydrogenase subunit G